MDEIDKNAYEEVCRALVGWQGGFRDRDIETVADEILTATGLTSKLAALEDENKTLREAAEALSTREAVLQREIKLAIDLLAERVHRNAARSPGHNARLVLEAALSKPAALPAEGKGESGRCKVPAGQTPLNDNLNHPLLDVYREGQAAREAGTISPYHGHSLEHCLHAAGWVARDLRMALDAAKATPPAPQPLEGAVKVKALEWAALSTGWIAHTAFHSYEVVKTDRGFMATYANRDFAWGEEETMKAAAQADYERRILSSLSPAPQPLDEMVKAAHAAVEELANTRMELSLEDWSRISSAILAALSPAPQPVGEVRDVTALKELMQRWSDGFAFNEDSEEDVELRDAAEAELSFLSASPSPAAQEDGE